MTVTPLVRPLAHGTLVPRPTERQMRILSFAIKNMMPPLHQNLLLAFCGPPGCGKTYLAQYLVALGVSRGMWTRSQSITTALQAVRCQTLRGNHLHAMFGWIPGVKMSFQKYVGQARDNMTDRNREKIRSARILVIDEMTQLDAIQMRAMSKILSDLRLDPLPFGGLHVIVTIDYLQLGPVENNSCVFDSDFLNHFLVADLFGSTDDLHRAITPELREAIMLWRTHFTSVRTRLRAAQPVAAIFSGASRHKSYADAVNYVVGRG